MLLPIRLPDIIPTGSYVSRGKWRVVCSARPHGNVTLYGLVYHLWAFVWCRSGAAPSLSVVRTVSEFFGALSSVTPRLALFLRNKQTWPLSVQESWKQTRKVSQLFWFCSRPVISKENMPCYLLYEFRSIYKDPLRCTLGIVVYWLVVTDLQCFVQR